MVANAAHTSPFPKMARIAIKKKNIRDVQSDPSSVQSAMALDLFVV